MKLWDPTSASLPKGIKALGTELSFVRDEHEFTEFFRTTG